MAPERPRALGAAATALAAMAAVWWTEPHARRREHRPRPVHDLPRTARVLSAEDCAYLAGLYRSHASSWSKTYLNLLAHRWRTQDKRLAAIFRRVIEAANSLPGGGGDYAITSDFFSLRAPGVVQFAPESMFHMDCEFWKVEESDGLNLWILVEHADLPTAFDVAERSRNPQLYADYDGAQYFALRPVNATDERSAYMRAKERPALRFCNGHGDLLSWRVGLQLLARTLRRGASALGRPRRFELAAPDVTNVRLDVGEALVLREQELHRSDVHSVLAPSQRRLAVGFKMQRRGALITSFLPTCPAQKERMNLPLFWERVGARLADPYVEEVPAGSFHSLGAGGRWRALAEANAGTLAFLLALAALAGPHGARLAPSRVVAPAAAGVWAVLIGPVVFVQWNWLLFAERAQTGEGFIGRYFIAS